MPPGEIIFYYNIVFTATPGGPPTRSRPSSKMTKYVECWGADKPFANITDSTMAKNIGLAVCLDLMRLLVNYAAYTIFCFYF